MREGKMKKLILPSLCSLFFWNCNEQLPTNQQPGSQTSGVLKGELISGSIDIEPNDLTLLKKTHALAKASGLPIKDAMSQEVIAKYLAKALAKSLSEPNFGETIKKEVGTKFDGDYNVLWSEISKMPIGKGDFAQEIRAKFTAGAQSNGIIEMFDQFSRLQVAIPQNFEKWDGKSAILVTYVPFTKDDLKTDVLYAYDINLKEYKLDGKKSPASPVIVVSRNERTNNNGQLLGGIFVDAGDGSLVEVKTPNPVPSGNGTSQGTRGEWKFGYPQNKESGPAPLRKTTAQVSLTPRVPLNWDKIKVSNDLEGWFMGGMEVRMHLLTDKEVALTAQKEGVYEDNNYTVGTFLRNINEDISRYIGAKLTEIDDNDWDKNFTFKLSADVAKAIKGVDANGNARADIGYNFGGDTDDDYIGENNKIELGSQDVATYWTAGTGSIKFNYDPNVVEYDIGAMPYVSASTTIGRGNEWKVIHPLDVSDGQDVTYRIIIPQGETNTYRISTCDPLTNFDTMVQIFDKDQSTPYFSDDDYSCPSSVRHSTLNAQLSAGTYYIVVDGYGGYYGNFKLSIQKI
jgi:DUF3103 family protein